MSTPSEPDNGQQPRESVNLGKDQPTADEPFDPYRFGKPDHPIPAEYAPPGYAGPVSPTSPYQQPAPWSPPGSHPDNPFSNPPGTPYAGPHQPYQYPPPQQPGWGPPPPYPGYAQPAAGNGKAIAGLVLGIVSIITFWLMFFNVFVILGLIFSLIAMSEAKSRGGAGRGMAVAGLVCSLVGAIAATVFTVAAFNAADKCGGFSHSDRPGWEQCFRDHFG